MITSGLEEKNTFFKDPLLCLQTKLKDILPQNENF